MKMGDRKTYKICDNWTKLIETNFQKQQVDVDHKCFLLLGLESLRSGSYVLISLCVSKLFTIWSIWTDFFSLFLVILEEVIPSNWLNHSIKMFNLITFSVIMWLTVRILFLKNLYLVCLYLNFKMLFKNFILINFWKVGH